ncbi:AraC family transcriptional regulator [Mucilaginibacter sp. AW1-7]|jgi:AraC-like DNA-binding protein|uniref:AraC family transcriptional regulator n=1 Tax=unclassified Mucilaginibacter TaxID=2617802 RepID=UPI0008C84B05|nr:AraC family transcriptional regulator [Mucilaginibacter sp. OK283]SEP03396.1 transcriptional regulator, AraC family [Mucilaginibacter sp. OK283]
MKPQLLKVSSGPAHSFSVRHDVLPDINNRWHCHPELELIYLKKGSGTQFIGDSIKQFKSGDMVLVGPNLPHYWRFDDLYFNSAENKGVEVFVVHFCENFWGEQFLQLPENKLIKVLFEKSKRGLQITGAAKEKVAAQMAAMPGTDGAERIIMLLKALNAIATSAASSYMASIGFKYDHNDSENDRLNNIYEYSMQNFRKKIYLDEIAEIAGVSSNSFCRYFKSKTRKTFSQFIIEIKVGHACKLLIEDKLNIKQLCYDSGFNNFSTFHKHFKLVTGKSPLMYQKEFIKNS